MNLVQINERLKDLPMQVLQQYANGMNPEVPPYLALGELQRRETAQKQMATAQGAAQGPQPSVKEQVEQKAGLMALQQMQQQQMAQQMQQPRGPMPVPPGAPQPEAQPQPEMMARGGLAGIPVRRDMFEYAGGGIIAFQAGGKTPRIQDEVPISEEERERLRNELITRIVGEEARNPPVRRKPMEITESDTMTIPGMEKSNLMARAMNRQNREPAPEARVINLPKGTSAQEADLVRMQNPDANVVVEGQGDLLKSLAGRYQGNVEDLKKGLAGAFLYSSDAEAAKNRQRPQASYSNEGRSAPEMPQEPYSNEGRQPVVGIPSALPKAPSATPARSAAPTASAQMPGAPRPATTQAGTPRPTPAGAPAGIAAALQQAPQGNVTPFLAEAAAAARDKPVAPTAESIIAEQKKLLPESMQEDAVKRMIAGQRARAQGRQAAYEKSQPDGLDNLIRVLGQAGQYKGFSGIGPAYTALQQQRRAEDLAMRKQQDELLTAIEGRQYGADKELYTARDKSMTAANKSYQDRLMTNTKALADLAGVDQRRMDEALGRLNQVELEKMRSATQNRSLNEKLKFEADFLALKAQARELEAKGDTAGAAKADARANDMLSIRSGAAAGVGAGRNAIMERRLEMQNLEKIMKDEGMQYSEEEKREAAKEYRRLALLNSKGSGGSPAGEVDKTNPLLK